SPIPPLLPSARARRPCSCRAPRPRRPPPRRSWPGRGPCASDRTVWNSWFLRWAPKVAPRRAPPPFVGGDALAYPPRPMSAPLMISVAGVRGIVGESLTPPVLARFAAAFAAELPPGEIVVGRDARRSGPMAYRAVAAGLTAAGRHVADLGLATTPATQ